MGSVAEHIARVAEQVDAGAGDAEVQELLAAARTRCAQEAAGAAPGQRRLLANVQTALATWAEVWPRLGRQREFRAAVAREARLWSTRLARPDRA